MRLRAITALALGAVLACAAAIATAAEYEPSRHVCVHRAGVATVGRCQAPSTLAVSFEGRTRPGGLPAAVRAPVALELSASISETDGSPPPGLRAVSMEFDKGAEIDAGGLPTCARRTLEANGVAAARRLCRAAIVGTGLAHVTAGSGARLPLPLTLFNAGSHRGTITTLLQATGQGSTPLVAAVETRRVHRGRYGLASELEIPRLAAGASVVGFRLTIRRAFVRDDASRSYLSARCRDGRLQALASFRFLDGSLITGSLVQPCSSTN